MNINKNIFFRFEPFFDDGILVIYNYANGDLFESDYELYQILDRIEQYPNCSLNDIVSNIGIEPDVVETYIRALLDADILV